MTRVSENSSRASITHSINKAKKRLEDLQLKGSTLRDITKPSDNPISNVEALAITSTTNDNKQYTRNSDYALLHLNVTEKSIEQLTELLGKAKEIAIAQASDFYGADVRRNVASEVKQLKNQAVSIANKRIGNKFIFSGFATLTRPFDESGKYFGDKGHIQLEVSKDFFVPINLNGEEVFYTAQDTSSRRENPFEHIPEVNRLDPDQGEGEDFELPPDAPAPRGPASISGEAPQFENRANIFGQLDLLTSALENNDTALVQDLLEKFDNSINRLITLRTKIGSISSSIESSKLTLESENIDHATRRSELVDADVADLFSDIARHQSILETTYKSSQGLLNKTLIDFLR